MTDHGMQTDSILNFMDFLEADKQVWKPLLFSYSFKSLLYVLAPPLAA